MSSKKKREKKDQKISKKDLDLHFVSLVTTSWPVHIIFVLVRNPEDRRSWLLMHKSNKDIDCKKDSI